MLVNLSDGLAEDSILAIVTCFQLRHQHNNVLYGAAKAAGQSHSNAPQLSRQRLQRLEVASGMHVVLCTPLMHNVHTLLAMMTAGRARRWSINSSSTTLQ